MLRIEPELPTLRIEPELAAERIEATLITLATLRTLNAEYALKKLRHDRKLTAPV